jgi:hypothetical protein
VVVRMAEEGKLVDDEEVEASETRVESWLVEEMEGGCCCSWLLPVDDSVSSLRIPTEIKSEKTASLSSTSSSLCLEERRWSTVEERCWWRESTVGDWGREIWWTVMIVFSPTWETLR